MSASHEEDVVLELRYWAAAVGLDDPTTLFRIALLSGEPWAVDSYDEELPKGWLKELREGLGGSLFLDTYASHDEVPFAWVPDKWPDGRFYLVVGWACFSEDGIYFDELTIRPGPVDGIVLRSIPVARIRSLIRRELLREASRQQDSDEAGVPDIVEEDGPRRRLLEAAESSLDQRNLGDDFLRTVAEVALVEAIGPWRGFRARTAAALREQGGDPRLARATGDKVRGWLVVARREGWLAPAKQGETSVAEGPRLIEEKRQAEETR